MRAEHRDRLVTILDEAFGLQPVMDDEELLTCLESRLYQMRVESEVVGEGLRRAEAGWTRALGRGALDEIRHAFFFAKALPSLTGFTVEQQRGLIRDAWNEADRTMELVRDEAQLRMRPIVERNLRPHESPRTILEDIGFLPKRGGSDAG